MSKPPPLTESAYLLRTTRANEIMHRVGVSNSLAYDRVRDLMRATDRLPTEKELTSKLRRLTPAGMSPEMLAKVILAEVRKPAPRKLAPG